MLIIIFKNCNKFPVKNKIVISFGQMVKIEKMNILKYLRSWDIDVKINYFKGILNKIIFCKYKTNRDRIRLIS